MIYNLATYGEIESAILSATTDKDIENITRAITISTKLTWDEKIGLRQMLSGGYKSIRLHLSPEIHSIINKHKTAHNHENFDETVICLLRLADKLCFTKEETKVIYSGLYDYLESPDENLVTIAERIIDKLSDINISRGSG
jgi:hypothetical protein